MNPHPSRPVRTALLLAACLAAAPAAAQVRFQAQPDTLYYEDLNPYRMYAVQGADTLGSPVRGFAIQREVWRDSAGVLVVERISDEVQVRGKSTRTRARFDARGTAQRHGGVAPDFSMPLRLPADGVLAAGRVWQDTVDQTQSKDGSDYTYVLTHALRVERLVDTLGARMAVVRGTGRLRYRQSSAPESPGAAAWWIDVSGPVDETFLFDVDRGRLAAREWWMDLRGASAIPDGAGGADTLPAGLLSMDTTRLIPAERARLLARELPACDTSVTSTETGEILLHTVRRAGPSLESGMRRSDGSTVTVQARHEGGRAVRYALLHTAPCAEPLRRTVELRGDALHVTGGGRDTTLALPAGPWAVSDEGMDEHLAGAVARMAVEGQEEGEISILRPMLLRWDLARVQLIPVEDAWLAVVRTEPGGLRDETTLLLVTKAGGLLYAEGVEPQPSLRLPPRDSPREKQVKQLLEALLRSQPGAQP